MTKKPFLAVYDYGQGGVWVVINAASPAEILEKYPELTVREEVPSWMTQDAYDRIASRMTVDIADPPTSWLRELVESRSR